MQQKRDYSKRQMLFRVVITCVVLILGWYGVGRVLSPWRAIHLVESHNIVASIRPVGQPLRVVAYNIAHGRGTDDSNWTSEDERRDRLKNIGALLRDRDADVVVLNEVDFSSVWSGHENQAALIAKEAGYRYRAELCNIDASVPFVSLRFGNAVLSRYPIVETELIDLPGYAAWETVLGGKKRAMACTIEIEGGDQIVVVAAHLDTRGDEKIRVESARSILNALPDVTVPTIIAGDLNSSLPDQPGARLVEAGQTGVSVLLEDGGFTTGPADLDLDTYAATFPSWEPVRTIDWILVRLPLEVASLEVKPTDRSDHLPVIAEVVIAEPD